MLKLAKLSGFEWDKGNISKNWIKHKIKIEECEQIFFNQPLIINLDAKHSQAENRFYALGKTYTDKLLFIVFTVRDTKIRIISARSMNKKEKLIYEKQ